MYKISELENIAMKFRERLLKVGIETQEQLLTQACLREKRQQLEQKTDISAKLLLKWVKHADFVRIHGIGHEYAELLEHSGVTSVQDLAQYDTEKLLQRLQTFNNKHKFVQTLPSSNKISSWIQQAQTLPAIIQP